MGNYKRSRQELFQTQTHIKLHRALCLSGFILGCKLDQDVYCSLPPLSKRDNKQWGCHGKIRALCLSTTAD